MDSSRLLRPLLHKYIAIKEDWIYGNTQRNCFQKILKENKINVVIDVGAHAGETGQMLREKGKFTGKIISFEPIQEKFSLLQKKAGQTPPWECHHCALGNETGTKQLTIFNNPYGSSFLSINSTLQKECNLQKSREETVQIKRLEDLFPSLCGPSDSVLLKLDTQGFEMPILEGAGKYLQRICLIKLEASFIPLYEGETLIGEMIQYMRSKNFIPVLIEQGHISETLYQLQADIIFLNETHSHNASYK